MSDIGWITAAELREQFKENRDGWNESLRVRVHRAISWLQSAEKHSEDNDIALLSLMISLHACYLTDEFSENQTKHSAKESWARFTKNLQETSQMRQLQMLLQKTDHFGFLMAVSMNPYLHAETYSDGLEAGKAAAKASNARLQELFKKDATSEMLIFIFENLNTLRNQIAHGSRTYDSELNSSAVEQGKQFLFEAVPLIIEALIENPEVDWGELEFSVVK